MKNNKPKTEENTNDADFFPLEAFTKSDLEKMDKEELECLLAVSRFLRSFMKLSAKARKKFTDAFETAWAQAFPNGKPKLETENKSDEK